MSNRIFFGILVSLLIISMLTLAFNIQPVVASGTIYIRADGKIDMKDISSVARHFGEHYP